MVDIFKLLFKEKPALILISLLNSNKSQSGTILSKNIICTHCHIVNILQYLEKSKLIKSKKEGRIKNIELTDDGKKLAEYLREINEFLKKLEQKNLNNKNGTKRN